MENTALLSPADVTVIRRYVHTKYAPLPGGRRAEIVADAIRRTLEKRLPDLPPEIKGPMTDELIRRCLVAEQRDVRPDDVFDICAEMDIENDKMELISNSLLRWLDDRAPGGRWSPEQIASRIARRKAAGLESAIGVIEPNRSSSSMRLRSWAWAAVTALATAVAAVSILLWPNAEPVPKTVSPEPQAIVSSQPASDIGMPKELQFAAIDSKAVKEYLRGRDALIAEEPYFGAIVESARAHNVHPLLLFAIVGQEQGFVPKTNKKAKEIANNPFNVFHSWEEYNTDIGDSSNIAAKLIARLGRERPEGQEPFSWFNETYAEDPAWSDGVRNLFVKLNSLPQR
ncbi:hypothetical protein ACFPVX_02120 [Cohnella faecalis]|uniref:Uncharacterized protein n=1 Tax=Cohnella faecalis TaxID=2315694 RepID=A0A398CW76_9BACL|nr:hypothetical protein [Cohnella faecalis]RIE04798.1 hypothetical protein D3H35_04835 [Cohnella faecalis]